jgi:hypothetical protein
MLIRTIILDARLVVDCAGAGARERPALSVVRQLWRRFGGASNCGFSTWNRGMATVSGIGGFCARNQFYNPRPSSNRSRKRPTYY